MKACLYPGLVWFFGLALISDLQAQAPKKGGDETESLQRRAGEEGDLFDGSEAMKQLHQKVEHAASVYLSNNHGVAMAVGIVKGHKFGMLTFGTTSPGGHEKPTSKTIFRVASLTKTFTATLLALYLEHHTNHNVLNPVQSFLPGTTIPSYQGQPIRLQDLVTHTAGFSRLAVTPGTRPPKPFTAQDMLHFVSGYQLTRAPGSKYEYSNVGFSLLSITLAQAEHKNWEAMAESEITSKLGLVDTKLILNDQEMKRRLLGYDVHGNPLAIELPLLPP